MLLRVPVLPDVASLCNGRANAIRKDLQSFFDLCSESTELSPVSVGQAFREFGLSELLFCFEFEDEQDLYDLVMQHVFGTLRDSCPVTAALPVLLVAIFFQECTSSSRVLKLTIEDLRVLGSLHRSGTALLRAAVRKILSTNAEICSHQTCRQYMDAQCRRVQCVASEDPTAGEASVSTGRAVRAVASGLTAARLFNADSNAVIFDEKFLHKHGVYNEIYPLLKDLTTLIPPPIHNPHAAVPLGETPTLTAAVPSSEMGSEDSRQQRKRPGGVAILKHLAYKLNKPES